MKLYYTSRKLEKILTNPRLIKKEYTRFYEQLSNRLSELRAANSLEEIPHVPPPRRHKLTGDYKHCWGVDVSRNYRIVFKPIEDELDPKSISEIEILRIEDYH